MQSAFKICPENCLNAVKGVGLNELPTQFVAKGVDITEVESRWKNLLDINWVDVQSLSTEQFWISVYKYKNSVGKFVFKSSDGSEYFVSAIK